MTLINLFFLFKHKDLNFCDLFAPAFENLHNLIRLNDVFDTNIILDDSSICDSENNNCCETEAFSNV